MEIQSAIMLCGTATQDPEPEKGENADRVPNLTLTQVFGHLFELFLCQLSFRVSFSGYLQSRIGSVAGAASPPSNTVQTTKEISTSYQT
jgi:hypothetical protein